MKSVLFPLLFKLLGSLLSIRSREDKSVIVLGAVSILFLSSTAVAQEEDKSAWPKEFKVIEEKYLPPIGTYAATPQGWQDVKSGKIYDEKWLKEEKGIIPERYLTIIPDWVEISPEEEVLPESEDDLPKQVELDDNDPALGNNTVLTSTSKNENEGRIIVAPRPYPVEPEK